MPERARHTTAVLALAGAIIAAGVVAVIVSELAPGESFEQGRHDDSEWVQVFHDDFDTEALAEHWNTCHWWDDGGCTIASNDELQWYLPSQVAIKEGKLQLTAEERQVEAPDGRRFDHASGMVTTGPPSYRAESRFDFTYGRVEARVRVPVGTGLWSAVWLLPSTSESRPEIDMLEVLGDDTTEWILHFHPLDRSRESDGHRVTGPDLSTGFHNIGLEWEPGLLRWFIDGEQVWSVAGDHVPDEPMYLVANLAVGGVYPGPPTADTEFPARFEIDRVTVWQRRT
jgi:beta-glucanase (GH16 family)